MQSDESISITELITMYFHKDQLNEKQQIETIDLLSVSDNLIVILENQVSLIVEKSLNLSKFSQLTGEYMLKGAICLIDDNRYLTLMKIENIFVVSEEGRNIQISEDQFYERVAQFGLLFYYVKIQD